MFAVQFFTREHSLQDFDSREDIFLGFPTLFESFEEAKAFVEADKRFKRWQRINPQSARAELEDKIPETFFNLPPDKRIETVVFIAPVVASNKAKKRRIFAGSAGHWE